ncbi:hypothetical protein MMC30_003141 [Trapelia coarctata]|nr:hypothetical protein [Trapelia coarctata]
MAPREGQCPKCNIRPGGFRSKNELRRHHERFHTPVQKYWVCIDISSDRTKLANSHLRRAHFNPRPKGKFTHEEMRERRRERQWANWPPMEELRMWMEQREERSISDELGIPGEGFMDEINDIQDNCPLHKSSGGLDAVGSAD